MHDPSFATDRRLEALEMKAAFADDLLDRLNLVVYRQQEQIDRLVREIDRLRGQLAAADSGGAPRDEPPPHY